MQLERESKRGGNGKVEMWSAKSQTMYKKSKQIKHKNKLIK
jgi:hypothetical protein